MVLLDWLVLQLETLDFDMLILNLIFWISTVENHGPTGLVGSPIGDP